MMTNLFSALQMSRGLQAAVSRQQRQALRAVGAAGDAGEPFYLSADEVKRFLSKDWHVQKDKRTDERHFSEVPQAMQDMAFGFFDAIPGAQPRNRGNTLLRLRLIFHILQAAYETTGLAPHDIGSALQLMRAVFASAENIAFSKTYLSETSFRPENFPEQALKIDFLNTREMKFATDDSLVLIRESLESPFKRLKHDKTAFRRSDLILVLRSIGELTLINQDGALLILRPEETGVERDALLDGDVNAVLQNIRPAAVMLDFPRHGKNVLGENRYRLFIHSDWQLSPEQRKALQGSAFQSIF